MTPFWDKKGNSLDFNNYKFTKEFLPSIGFLYNTMTQTVVKSTEINKLVYDYTNPITLTDFVKKCN